MISSPPRSYLFVPGNRGDRFAKAYDSGAHAVILDLEDSVSPSEKSEARSTIAAWLSAERPVFLRVNSVDTEWFRDDMRLCELPGVAGVVLSKTQSSEEIRALCAIASDSLTILPLIETAQGFWNALSIAGARNVQRLFFGTIDFRADIGIPDEELLFFRSQLVLVSRIAGIAPPVDGVSTRIDDGAQLRTDALRARTLGFGGKLCIHPRQIRIVNDCFLPSPEEFEWARRIMDAAATSGGAAIAVEGEMVDRPVLARARAILSQTPRPPSES